MMAYQSGYVVSILVKGKPIREFNQGSERTCRIPFNSEYVIRIKNPTNLRAKVAITIDGTDVLDGRLILLSPRQGIDLERFVDLESKGRKFKFISVEKGAITGEVQDPTSRENGLVEVTFYPELESILTVASTFTTCPSTRNRVQKMSKSSPGGGNCCEWVSSSDAGATTQGDSISAQATEPIFRNMHCESSDICFASIGPVITNDWVTSSTSTAGATTEGGVSDQKFNVSHDHFETTPVPVVIRIRLKGSDSSSPEYEVLVDGRRVAIVQDQAAACHLAAAGIYGGKQVTIKPVNS